MEMITVTGALFEAFATGEILTDDVTYSAMMEEFGGAAGRMQAGTMDEDTLSCLQYAAMRAGFYAGISAMRTLFTGR